GPRRPSPRRYGAYGSSPEGCGGATSLSAYHSGCPLRRHPTMPPRTGMRRSMSRPASCSTMKPRPLPTSRHVAYPRPAFPSIHTGGLVLLNSPSLRVSRYEIDRNDSPVERQSPLRMPQRRVVPSSDPEASTAPPGLNARLIGAACPLIANMCSPVTTFHTSI